MPETPELEFWYEFASPYSYLSAMRIETLASSVGVKVKWQPFLLGPIFKAQGWDDSPFNLYPAKGRYLWLDMARQAQKYKLAFTRPSHFPRNTVLATRIALTYAHAPWVKAFAMAVFQANFADDNNIQDISIISNILSTLELDPDTICEQAQTPPNKAKLRAQLQRANDLGIFGAPSFVLQNTLFWGNDRLEDAILHSREHSATHHLS